jgi:hypothetical protein
MVAPYQQTTDEEAPGCNAMPLIWTLAVLAGAYRANTAKRDKRFE